VAAQLAGHHKALTGFLVKTLGVERGWAWIGVALFLAWRLAKTGYRMIRRLMGRDPLPFSFLARIFVGSLSGLGSYRVSRGRMRSQTQQSGGRPPRLTGQLSELWRYRGLVWNLAARDLKVKYQRSWLGFLWTLLNPLITIGVLITVFSYVVRLPIDHYWAFLISGYFAWNFFSQTVNGGVQAALGNAYLTRSAYFPQEALVVSSALARLLEFLGELSIVLVLLAIFHHNGIPLSFMMILPLIPVLFLLVIGISLPLVTLAVYYNDVVQAVPLATMMLFYASPVFYNVDLVPQSIRTIYLLNPLALLLNQYHVALYGGQMPALGGLLGLAGVAFGLGLLGYTLFNRRKRQFAEIV
jgi:ABC-type polysaccharide/polyol phosphate export permease